ncbi:ATP-binding cassette domain-containing protein [Lysinibacter sp. HNR]|uniref:ATP-binding cassette domain-containing protein n=1 Tax=Lysinibacter sp. HNR TaxID=3031408 RepID=UPI0024360924|nr:ATP-binding cassette domain-containing protein [Lysinibacter sp. HNR]WGD36557.1 ATP-binding cassette domain-containing protein [Lysinibacter sp. HNR]
MVEHGARGDDIIVSDLSVYYPSRGGSATHQAIEGVNFTVAGGAVCGVLGESGSGKSTLIQFLAARGNEMTQRGIQPIVNGGEATVLGVNLTKLSKRKRNQLTAHIGYLGQSDGSTLMQDRTIADSILEPIAERSKDFDRQAVGLIIAELMDQLALPLTMLHSYPSELSKGQRQRIVLVRALVTQPKILVADEPTLGVDLANRPKIADVLERQKRERGMTMLLVSHDISVLERLVEDLVILQNGSMVGHGPINEVFSATKHSYVQRLAEALRETAYDELALD